MTKGRCRWFTKAICFQNARSLDRDRGAPMGENQLNAAGSHGKRKAWLPAFLQHEN